MIEVISRKIYELAHGPELSSRLVNSVMSDMEQGSMNIVEASALMLALAGRHVERAYVRDCEYVIEVSTRWPMYDPGTIEVCIWESVFRPGYRLTLRYEGWWINMSRTVHDADYSSEDLLRELALSGKSDQFERLFEAAGYKWIGDSYC